MIKCAVCNKVIEEHKVARSLVKGASSRPAEEPTATWKEVCYPCSAKVLSDRMSEVVDKAPFILYVDDKARAITDWTGHLRLPFLSVRTGRHNIAGSRRTIWFRGPDGRTWTASVYGDNQYARCFPLKKQRKTKK